MYLGCKKEIADKRDYKMYICSAKPAELPEQYEIKMPDIKDQGIVNSCVAHSLATFLEETHKEENIKFSTGFIYGYRPLGYSQSEGMYPRQAMKTLLKVGDVPKERFDHNKEMPEIKNILDAKFNELKDLADIYRINSYSRIYTNQQIKQCIFNDIAVPISVPVYNNLKTTNNIVDMPSGELEGYHMMIIYGYCKEGWLIQNSWGKDWANKGRAILPYDYELDTAWAIETENNNVVTYTTLWQKLYNIIMKIIRYFTK